MLTINSLDIKWQCLKYHLLILELEFLYIQYIGTIFLTADMDNFHR